ncbi:PREDICTED: MATH and LRR domain-containing protein PFE0570w-like isoform X2 [Diuraphis noxia]|uniref:MATH and LRR domain-containing protein PFE0570w-like isoform X2 n=1 Tax=Diuraphis noxia TaxID=143948 RepID=UPI000763A9A7|nr:PREDICTED: MATH and LRR domain-containing protein PFE0570w-like isoform X2 [Diuraphis noxia]
MANQPYDDIEQTAEKELDALIVASQMESNFDIDKILNDKAKKRKLTKTNVKNLIKNVITNVDVATMLRQTLDDNIDANCLYEPKFTRAKIREMLNTYPTFAPQLSINQQQSILSECSSLIEKEFPDDSEDEEYHPDDKMFEEEEDEYDDDEFKSKEVNKSFDTENDPDISDNKTVVDNLKETIGMRTRSKFPLNDTPLEIIEQAFIPPDITEDMYDSACENDEWMEFLSEFTKPLESVQNDDGEDDPEYNVLGDDDFTNVDKEEFRIDKSVKVTRKEYNDLMNELNEFTESFLEFNGVETFETNTDIKKTENDKNTVKPKNETQIIPAYTCVQNNYCDGKSIANSSLNNKNLVKRTNCISNPVFILSCSNGKSSTNGSTNNYVEPIEVARYNTHKDKKFSVSEFNKSLLKINEHLEKSSSILPLPTFKENFQLGIEQYNNSNKDVSQDVNIKSQVNIMTQKQIILFKQQLTQHVQLITQNYLLCTLSKKFQNNCRKYKIMLELLKNVCKDKKYAPININFSLNFIQDWTEFKTSENDINSDYVVLPLYVKGYMLYYDKPVFIYPQLLPTRTYHHEYKSYPIGPSEEKLLVLKIDYIYKNLKESTNTRAKYKNKNLSDLMPMILKTVHKRWFSNRTLRYLKQFVTKQKNSFEMNVMKNYLTYGEIEECSYVIDIKALFKGNRLYECDIRKFPSSWKSIKNQF